MLKIYIAALATLAAVGYGVAAEGGFPSWWGGSTPYNAMRTDTVDAGYETAPLPAHAAATLFSPLAQTAYVVPKVQVASLHHHRVTKLAKAATQKKVAHATSKQTINIQIVSK